MKRNFQIFTLRGKVSEVENFLKGEKK